MNLFNLIGQVFKPATELIDNLHTSEEEKLEKKATLLELQTTFLGQALEYEKNSLDRRAEIITAEAQSETWVTRSWRPIAMLTFLTLVVLDSFSILPNKLSGEAWTLLQIGLGGYVTGRSIEKVIPAVTNVLKKKDST